MQSIANQDRLDLFGSESKNNKLLADSKNCSLPFSAQQLKLGSDPIFLHATPNFLLSSKRIIFCKPLTRKDRFLS